MHRYSNPRIKNFHHYDSTAPVSIVSESDSHTPPYEQMTTVWETAQGADGATPIRANSQRSYFFVALFEAIRRMRALPHGHRFHLDTEAGKRSEALLGMLANNLDIDPPRMFSQDDGEALVLTWDSERLKRLLTVTSEDFDLMDIHKASNVRCNHELDFQNANDLSKWAQTLGGTLMSRSNTSDDDVL